MNDCTRDAPCMGRREFLVKAGLIAGGTLLTVSSLGGAALGAAFEDVTIDVTADSPLAKAGGSQIVDSSAGKIIVINEGAGNFAAFSAICTHKGGIVGFDASVKKIICPKHGSEFDGATGAVSKGPADAPLKSYPAKETGSKLSISVT